MGWGKVKNVIGKAAPVVGSLLGGPAGGAVGALLSSVLGVENTPEAVEKELKGNPDAILKLRQLESKKQVALQQMLLTAETARLAEVNQTMRAEAASNDSYVRRWRPTFGYVISITWAAQVFGICYAMIGSPANAAGIIGAVTALTPMWGIALAVLGINVTKRSQDKAVKAGQEPATLLGALASRLQK